MGSQHRPGFDTAQGGITELTRLREWFCSHSVIVDRAGKGPERSPLYSVARGADLLGHPSPRPAHTAAQSLKLLDRTNSLNNHNCNSFSSTFGLDAPAPFTLLPTSPAQPRWLPWPERLRTTRPECTARRNLNQSLSRADRSVIPRPVLNHDPA